MTAIVKLPSALLMPRTPASGSSGRVEPSHGQRHARMRSQTNQRISLHSVILDDFQYFHGRIQSCLLGSLACEPVNLAHVQARRFPRTTMFIVERVQCAC